MDVAPGVRLWTEQVGAPAASPLLLIMGINASGVLWPDEFMAMLAERHRVIRYDHRDTGRSTWGFDEHPYKGVELAGDAIRVLDALGIDAAHVVGMSMGGALAQVLLLDHPERFLTATLVCTTTLDGGAEDLPRPDPRLFEDAGGPAEDREREAELDWRVENWRRHNGDALPLDAEAFRRLEARVMEHSGREDFPTAHLRADHSGPDRFAELAGVRTPTLVVQGGADPMFPPPHGARLAAAIPPARLVTIPAMGHVLNPPILGPLADAILRHTTTAT
ncbi:MAG: putative hydrolase [Solirubrobacterales bacterium]|nr:putative hydrolase [Solirubrobacterales bacterium]